VTGIRSDDDSMIDDRRSDRSDPPYTSRQRAHKNQNWNRDRLVNVYEGPAYTALRKKRATNRYRALNGQEKLGTRTNNFDKGSTVDYKKAAVAKLKAKAKVR
jgi:hypothetical protein